MKNNSIKIIVIDSGVSEHKAISKEIECLDTKYVGGQYDIIKSEKADNIGHGTAVTFIISHNLDNAEIINIRIYDDDKCDPEKLIFVLEYIYQNIECKKP